MPDTGIPPLYDEQQGLREIARAREAILSDPLFREFAGDIAVRLARLEAAGMMPEAVAIRAGLWPPIAEWNGYPVVRLVSSSAKLWGVIA